MVNDILVIKINGMLTQELTEKMRRDIEEQRKTGTVILPPYCDAILVPEDIAIRMMNAKGELIDP